MVGIDWTIDRERSVRGPGSVIDALMDRVLALEAEVRVHFLAGLGGLEEAS